MWNLPLQDMFCRRQGLVSWEMSQALFDLTINYCLSVGTYTMYLRYLIYPILS